MMSELSQRAGILRTVTKRSVFPMLVGAAMGLTLACGIGFLIGFVGEAGKVTGESFDASQKARILAETPHV